jgi:hypothetical protein
MKPGDLVKYTVEDSILFDDSDDVTPPRVGVVIMCRANTVDVLVQGKIDRMVPTGWLELIDEAR